MHRAQLQGFLLLQACCSWWPERPKLLQSRSHQQSLNEQMLRRKSRWALQNLGYPENKELEMLSKDRRCRWRQAAGSILGFGQSWESRAGLCAPAPRQSFPEGSYGPGPAFLETTGAALGSLTAALCSAYYKIFGSRTGTMVHPGFHGLPCLWDDEAGG